MNNYKHIYLQDSASKKEVINRVIIDYQIFKVPL